MSRPSPEYFTVLRRLFYQLVGTLTFAALTIACSPEATPTTPCTEGTVTHRNTLVDGTAEFDICTTDNNLAWTSLIPALDALDPTWNDPNAILIEPTLTLKGNKITVKKAEVDGNFKTKLMLSDGTIVTYLFTESDMAQLIASSLSSPTPATSLQPAVIPSTETVATPLPSSPTPAPRPFPSHPPVEGNTHLVMTAAEKKARQDWINVFCIFPSIALPLTIFGLSRMVVDNNYSRSNHSTSRPTHRVRIDGGEVYMVRIPTADDLKDVLNNLTAKELGELRDEGGSSITAAVSWLADLQDTAARIAAGGGQGKTMASSYRDLLTAQEIAKGNINLLFEPATKYGVSNDNGRRLSPEEQQRYVALRENLLEKANNIVGQTPIQAFEPNYAARSRGDATFLMGAAANYQREQRRERNAILERIAKNLGGNGEIVDATDVTDITD